MIDLVTTLDSLYSNDAFSHLLLVIAVHLVIPSERMYGGHFLHRCSSFLFVFFKLSVVSYNTLSSCRCNSVFSLFSLVAYAYSTALFMANCCCSRCRHGHFGISLWSRCRMSIYTGGRKDHARLIQIQRHSFKFSANGSNSETQRLAQFRCVIFFSPF